MLNDKNGQLSYFDLEIFKEMIPEDHPLVKIKKNVDFSFVDKEVEHYYSKTTGRPCIQPEKIFRILFLEIWANLSDVQVCRELKYNVLYRWFCDLAWQDTVPDDTTLVVFRKRIGEEGFHRLFNCLVEQIRKNGLMHSKWVLIDGTKLMAHVAVKNTLTLVREGRKRILKTVAKSLSKKAKEISQLQDPLPEKEYNSHTDLLAAEIERGRELVSAIKSANNTELSKEISVFEKILNGEGIASFSDPDARWGFKKKGEPFLGYKIHTACNEQGIVTAVKITPGNESEMPQLTELVENVLERGFNPRRLAADKAYDSSDIREQLTKKKISPYIPAKPTNKKKQEGFIFNKETDCIFCPSNKGSIGKTEHQNGGFIYYFSEKACKKCPHKNNCVGEGSTHKKVYVNERVNNFRVKSVKIAMNVRKTIERVFGDVKDLA